MATVGNAPLRIVALRIMEQPPLKIMWALIFILALPVALLAMWESAAMRSGALSERLLVAACAYAFGLALSFFIVIAAGLLIYFLVIAFGAMGHLLPGVGEADRAALDERPAGQDTFDFI